MNDLIDARHKKRLRKTKAQLIEELEALEHEFSVHEERMQLTIKAISSGFWDWNVITGDMIYSDSWTEVLGYEPEEIEPSISFWQNLVHPDDIEGVMASFDEYFNNDEDTYIYEYRLRQKSGDYRWFRDQGKVIEFDESGKPVRMVGTDTDVTKQHNIELALKESRTQFQSILDQSTSIICLKDIEGRYLLVNKTFERLFKVLSDDIIGKLPQEVVTDDVVESSVDQDREVINSKQASTREETFVVDGEVVTLLTSKFPIFDEEQNLTSVGVIATDITEQKLVDEALRKSRSMLQSILDFSPVTISVKDMEGNYLLVNKRQQDLFNIPVEDMEGANVKKVLPESLLKSALAQEKELLETMQPSVREHQFHVDDQYFTMLTSKFLIMDDEQNPTGIGTMAMDVTELKRAESALEKSKQELRDSEANFRAVVEQASDAFFLIDTTTAKFNEINNQACQMLGYSHDELLQLSVPDVDKSYPIEKFSRLIDSLVIGGPVTIETVLHRKDDTTFPAEIRTGLIESNEELYLLALVRDISERTKAEQALKILQQDQIRNERLVTLGQLTATVSHELRNPLGAMRPSLYLLQKRLPTDDERLIAAFERLDRNIDRCDQIIDQMLDFTRIESVELKTLALDAWLGDELDEMEIPEGVRIVRDFGLDNLMLNFDPERLRRALINVYDNACQAMLEGNNQVSETTDLQLTIKTEATGQRIEIIISDTGPGIPEDVLPHIFEPLYSTKGFGVGLGLPTVQQALRQHGGDVEVLATSGRGTSILLWLPLPSPKEIEVAA